DLNTVAVFNLGLGVVGVALLTAAVVYLRRVIDQQTMLVKKIEEIKKAIDEDYAEPPPVEREEAAAPIEGLPIGAPAPDFSLTAFDGDQVMLDKLLGYGKSVLLLFVSPNCSPCKTLLPRVRVWERDYSNYLTIALLSRGTFEEIQKRLSKYGAKHLLLQG